MNSSVRSLLMCLFLFSIFLAANGEALAATRRVPADYPTIQQAINASANGDIVLVAPGIYAENINFFGKAITVTSESGPQVTIIDGGQKDSVIKFISGEGLTSVLNGFTIQNGFAQFSGIGNGGGILIQGTSPTIANNVITNNTAVFDGGGIAAGLSSAVIRDNTITNNVACQAPGIALFSGNPTIQRNSIIKNTQQSEELCFGGIGGGGIMLLGGTGAQILDNNISDNTLRTASGGGLSLFSAGAPLIRGNVISRNKAGLGNFDGGGIWIVNTSPAQIVQNLIIKNSADSGGGIFSLSDGVELINNTIADNDGPNGSGVASIFDRSIKVVNNLIIAKTGQTAFNCIIFQIDPVPPVFKFNDVFSPQGVSYGGDCVDQNGINGNFSADPLFVNPSADDYHLKPASPAIDTGDNTAPNLPATDLDGKPRIQDGNKDGVSVVDIGAYEFSNPFDICIQDDSSGSILQINTTTGDYQFTNCSGLTISGTGILTRRGSTITLQHTASDRRVMAKIDGGVNKATASIQILSQGLSFTITDRNTGNNTCSCR